jgi:hypothetical protein
MMVLKAPEIRQRKFYIIYECGEEINFSLIEGKLGKGKMVKSEGKKVYKYMPHTYVTEFIQKDIRSNKNKLKYSFELIIKRPVLGTYEYVTDNYSIDSNQFSKDIFHFGIKFLKNNSHNFHKEPSGKPLENKSKELVYFFGYVCNQYIHEMEQNFHQNESEFNW